jgi:putative membrane protein
MKKESSMQGQRMILHALAFVALGAMCMAQSSPGPQGMGQQGRPGMGQSGQPGMGQQGGMDPNSPSSMGRDNASDMMSPDRMFVTKAAQGGMAEVNLGNLAKQNGGSDSVKQFGSRMVNDHSQANDELRQLAQQKQITLPRDVSSKDKRLSKMLGSKQGSDFDKAYIHDMVKDHQTDVADFRNEAENGKDPDIKAWAQKTLPILEQHLAAAKEVAGQVGADTNKKSAGAMSSKP